MIRVFPTLTCATKATEEGDRIKYTPSSEKKSAVSAGATHRESIHPIS